MFNLLVTKAINPIPSNDIYGEGLSGNNINTLAQGSIVLTNSDGTLLHSDSGVEIMQSMSLNKDKTYRFATKDANGIKFGLNINPNMIQYTKSLYVSPIAHVIKITVAAPSDLSPYIGQYANIALTDTSEPEYRTSRTKNYSVVLNEANTDNIATLMTELAALINADSNAIAIASYGAGIITLTAKVAGKRIMANPEDIIRDSTVVHHVQPKAGTPTDNIKLLSDSIKSWEGININKNASDLHNVSDVVENIQYTVFTINTANPTGPSIDTKFNLTQYIAIPSGCTRVITDVESILNFISGDMNAVWS